LELQKETADGASGAEMHLPFILYFLFHVFLMLHCLSVTDDIKESQYECFDGTKIRLFVDEALSSSIVLCSLMCSITVVDKPIRLMHQEET
jgi:hypothetical protein